MSNISGWYGCSGIVCTTHVTAEVYFTKSRKNRGQNNHAVLPAWLSIGNGFFSSSHTCSFSVGFYGCFCCNPTLLLLTGYKWTNDPCSVRKAPCHNWAILEIHHSQSHHPNRMHDFCRSFILSIAQATFNLHLWILGISTHSSNIFLYKKFTFQVLKIDLNYIVIPSSILLSAWEW